MGFWEFVSPLVAICYKRRFMLIVAHASFRYTPLKWGV